MKPPCNTVDHWSAFKPKLKSNAATWGPWSTLLWVSTLKPWGNLWGRVLQSLWTETQSHTSWFRCRLCTCWLWDFRNLVRVFATCRFSVKHGCCIVKNLSRPFSLLPGSGDAHPLEFPSHRTASAVQDPCGPTWIYANKVPQGGGWSCQKTQCWDERAEKWASLASGRRGGQEAEFGDGARHLNGAKPQGQLSASPWSVLVGEPLCALGGCRALIPAPPPAFLSHGWSRSVPSLRKL